MTDGSRAHVAEYRGLDAAQLDGVLAELDAQLDAPPPELDGLIDVLVLADREAGRALVISVFDSAAGLERAAPFFARVGASQAAGVRTDAGDFDVLLRRTHER